MPDTRCLCGAVRIEIAATPASLTQCNCSVCRRYGAIWAYFPRAVVTVRAAEGALARWRRTGEAELDFVRCATCGCVMVWEGVERRPDARIGVNMRNAEEPAAVSSLPIEMLNGAGDWTVLSTAPRPELWAAPPPTAGS